MLAHGWAELAALLHTGPDNEPMARVQRLCALCVEVTGVTGAAISIATDDARSTVCATDDASDRLAPKRIEQAQVTGSRVGFGHEK